MTEKHTSAEWRRTTRTIRAQVTRKWAHGDEVTCWRHGHVIPQGAPYDVGHMDPHGGEGVDNAAPECRRGNRSHGGKIGAQLTNSRRSTRPTFRPLPWA